MALRTSILLALVACGGGSATSRIGPKGRNIARLEKVNPKAQKEFEAAMRALRLGGPEAMETAKARLKAALDIDPKIWEAWHDLGVIHYKDGEDDAAITAFSKALDVNKEHTPTLLARAEAPDPFLFGMHLHDLWATRSASQLRAPWTWVYRRNNDDGFGLLVRFLDFMQARGERFETVGTVVSRILAGGVAC